MTLKDAASEKRSLQDVLGLRDDYKKQATTVLARLRRIGRCDSGATVVDIGAAQGMFVLACAELGYNSIGIEPFAPARAAAREIADLEGKQFNIVDGSAESMPLENGRRCAACSKRR